MNPYTRFLIEQLDDPGLSDFVELWDELEALVIDIYRAGAADSGMRNRYQALQADFDRQYRPFREVLQPFWGAAGGGRARAARDPFEAIVSAGKANEFIENWGAMQTLPAARECLNQYIRSRLEGKD